MIIESGYLTEGLFGEALLWMLEILPYVDAAGWKPEWIIRTKNYGEAPSFNIFPGIIQTTYTPNKEPAGVISFEELQKKSAHRFNGDFHLASKYWTAFFRFTDDVLEQVESFCEQNHLGEDTLGLHYRGTDKNKDLEQTNPVSGSEFLCILDDFLIAHAEIKTLFVASDDFYFFERVEAFARGRIRILTHEQPRSKDGLPIFRRQDVLDNQKMAKFAILDCLTLSRCGYSLSCMSGLSAFAKVFNPDLKAYRVSSCKPDWFPMAHIPRYRGTSEAARKLLQTLQRDDWEDRVIPVREIWSAVVPYPVRCWIRDQRARLKRSVRNAVGDPVSVSLLQQTTPVSRKFGFDRGQPIDRYYIYKFLEEHADDIHGHVLEFASDELTRKFGSSKVTKVDVLHLTADNPQATLVADLTRGENLPSDTFDCIICTQVLPFIYDIHTAVRTLFRMLKPGGMILVTVAGVAHKVSCADLEQGGDYWRFTTLSIRRLFEEVFPAENIEVKAYGNVLAAIAFMHGYAVEDLKKKDLEYYDPDYQVSIALRAVKPQPVKAV